MLVSLCSFTVFLRPSGLECFNILYSVTCFDLGVACVKSFVWFLCETILTSGVTVSSNFNGD
jgi:hypothetical protein